MPNADTETNGHVPINKVDNLGAIIERFSERLTEIEQRLDHVEQSGREQRLQAVLDHAHRIGRDGVAVLNYKEVMAAADVSHTTAYSYMDQLAEEHDAVTSEPTPDGVERIKVNTDAFNPL